VQTKRLSAFALVVVLGSQAAWADTVDSRIQRAQAEHQSALEILHEAQARLRDVGGKLAAAQHLLDLATAEVISARDRERDASVRVALAQDVLTSRVRAIYENGPGTALDLLLSARSPSDLLSINEFTTHTMQADMDAVAEVRQGRARLARMHAALEARRETFVVQQHEVSRLVAEMQSQVGRAQTAAHRLGIRVKSLEKMRRRLEAARTQEALSQDAISNEMGDQSALLNLLGPSGGQSCDIPGGLRDTGRTISGDASWYGDEFAGDSTASGVIFDPSLFTAAHRTLPLGSFLRVHYDGRCAIVLVNDRGPYGNYGRIIDLAQAPAQYLGLGVGYVTADILLPR
jgi:rare lipoprotein A (peptidoglycan hydrolase)